MAELFDKKTRDRFRKIFLSTDPSRLQQIIDAIRDERKRRAVEAFMRELRGGNA